LLHDLLQLLPDIPSPYGYREDISDGKTIPTASHPNERCVGGSLDDYIEVWFIFFNHEMGYTMPPSSRHENPLIACKLIS
jgi:hypothetical protein